MIRLAESGQACRGDIQRLVWPAYLAGGAVITIASIFNPINPKLILLSGAGASFGMNSGLFLLPSLMARQARNQSTNTEHMPLRLGWLALAAIFGGVFISVPGPGIHFSN